jgi:hypothetical protein
MKQQLMDSTGELTMSDATPPEPRDDEPFDLEREPLDRSSPVPPDWGGDGSDLSRPVRAHVLAALRQNRAPYPPPVDALRDLGDPRGNAEIEQRRQALGFSQEHLPDLLRMARDRDLYTADGDSNEVWAPLHAVTAMGDVDLSDAVSELIPLFDLDDDWFSTALPELLGKVGAPALEPIRAYIADRTRWGFGHWRASDALEKIAEQHPELREQVVAILGDVLRDAEHYHEAACTGAMDALVELGAVEALPLIRHAFELGRIDETLRGPWGQVLNDLEVEPEEGDPLLAASQQSFEERQERFFPRAQREELLEALDRFSAHSREAKLTSAPHPAPRDAHRAAQEKARKQKNKRKAESAARKANRRKRK